ncbi:DUF421 domain-containing protein [Palleronia sediminis]|uniref:DUF421 domain-containing protein n=1 Tax=Palleronia sediminis TaxID=2547833 RepID=A0A4R6AMH6_9RHOB|nr:YetF domain-containing protein [Palleronia sediminis]TDL83738.1 DUF421 domain-containing protein [Palleronia sediminis]
MWWDGKGPLWHIPLSAALGFAALLFLLRLAGKRTVSQFNMYDLILTFTVGSILSSFIVLESVQILDAALALSSVIAMDWAISKGALLSKRFRKMIKAPPALLVFNGEMQKARMRDERIVEDEIFMFMRQNGIDRLSHVKAMILESSGEVSVFTDKGDGHASAKSLRRSGVEIPEGAEDDGDGDGGRDG